MVNIKINGTDIAVQNGSTILQAAARAGIPIPHLCYLRDINEIGACRICVVEVEGTERLVPACNTRVVEGMSIHTNTPRVREARKTNLRLILSQHNSTCTSCIRSGNCELQNLAHYLNIHYQPYPVKPERSRLDMDVPVIREASKGIKWMRCIQVCDKIQGMHIWDVVGTGSRTTVDVAGGRSLKDTDCTFCGQCVTHCPTGALTARDDTNKVLWALADPEITTVVQVAPAVRVAVGEAFGLEPGVNAINKLVSALKMMGADEVYDTTFGADLTVMEEADEFLERLKKGGPFPMFTSCCPAWVKYVEEERPHFLKNISTCKSPMEMFAAVLKDQYARKDEEDGRTTYHIAIMPCTAKKMEAKRPEFQHDGKPDVDLVLTTQEIIMMIKESGIRFAELEGESPDLPFGMGTGAATIFGTTGGVAEAVARRVVEDKSKNTLQAIQFSGIRGSETIRAVTLPVGDRALRIAVVHGLVNAQKLLDDIESGQEYFDLVEVMTCKTGCVGGAGQPYGLIPVKQQRAEGLYEADRTALIKRSERNPIVTKLLEGALKGRTHQLLHVEYKRPDKA